MIQNTGANEYVFDMTDILANRTPGNNERNNRSFPISVLKFTLGSEAQGDKTKEIIYSSLYLDVISFVLFPPASEPSVNFNISEMVYR